MKLMKQVYNLAMIPVYAGWRVISRVLYLGTGWWLIKRVFGLKTGDRDIVSKSLHLSITLAATMAIAVAGASPALGASDTAGQCAGYNDTANTHINTSDGAIVFEAGLTVCLKAGNGNTGEIVTDGVTSIAEYIEASGLLNDGGQVPGVSNYVVYGSPEATPTPQPTPTPEVKPTPTPDVTPTPEPSETHVVTPEPSAPTPTLPPTDTAGTTTTTTGNPVLLILAAVFAAVTAVALLRSPRRR